MISISSELSKRSYDLSNVKVSVETVPLPGIVRGAADVSVALGAKMLPVQNVVVPSCALSIVRVLSFPT